MGRVDCDPTTMWPLGQKQGLQGKRRSSAKEEQMSVESLNHDLSRIEQLAQHSCANISHKDQLALFVPASFVAYLATTQNLSANPPQ